MYALFTTGFLLVCMVTMLGITTWAFKHCDMKAIKRTLCAMFVMYAAVIVFVITTREGYPLSHRAVLGTTAVLLLAFLPHRRAAGSHQEPQSPHPTSV